jgi:hypothetical protein
MNNLGNIYRQGIGTEPDFDKALHYYKMAAEKNDTGAMSNLATLYLHMNNVDNYEAKSAEWFQKAAEGGLEHA